MKRIQVVRVLIVCIVLVALVFLPVFLLVNAVELELRGETLTRPSLGYHAGAAVVFYVSMLLPSSLGSVLYSIAVVILTRGARGGFRRIATICLAPLVPLTVILPDLSGGLYLSTFWLSTLLATIAYGIGCAWVIGKGVDNEMAEVVHRN